MLARLPLQLQSLINFFAVGHGSDLRLLHQVGGPDASAPSMRATLAWLECMRLASSVCVNF